jgi:hypothetical protein
MSAESATHIPTSGDVADAAAEAVAEARPISEHDRALRERIWRYILEHSEPWHREHLGRLGGLWERCNGAHFAAAMVVPVLLLNEPSNSRRLGDCGAISGIGCRSQIRIRPSLLRGTHPLVRHGSRDPEGLFRFVADVLLHEMIHQWQQEVTGEPEESYHGHGTGFRDKANEIGAKLGLPPVRAKHQKEGAGAPCQYWPYIVRPADEYYRGAYIPTSRDEGPGEIGAYHPRPSRRASTMCFARPSGRRG